MDMHSRRREYLSHVLLQRLITTEKSAAVFYYSVRNRGP